MYRGIYLVSKLLQFNYQGILNGTTYTDVQYPLIKARNYFCESVQTKTLGPSEKA